MASIGIVGAGVSALHLGLLLRQHDVPVTIYAEKSAEDVAVGRLLNTVAHHHVMLERERRLGIEHWDTAQLGYDGHLHYFGFPEPLQFRGEFEARSRAVDYRIYLPQLMSDFEAVGGVVEVGAVGVESVPTLADRHDLLVVAAGRGPLAAMFPVRADRRVEHPWRNLTAALYRGIAPNEPNDVTLGVAPGDGEIIEIPILSFDGLVNALLIEAVPGGALDVISDARYDEDPAGFEKLVLELLRVHLPPVFARIDTGAFGVTRPQDVLQGAITPCMREDYLAMPNGTFALAMGDAHVVMDPVVAQGANAASYSAEVVGNAILAGGPFDEGFCQRVAAERAHFLDSAYHWVNSMLGPPSPQLVALTVGMAMDKSVCDDFTDNFAHPDRQWANLATIEQTRAYLAGKGHDLDALLAAAGPPPGDH
ncbi:MAG TPA: styrene monooxygenase/indole monooxygenase family protein [Sporichthya sp.]|nr:styrene monooxygenase/indole monooxygenase family protein [Sporichthya sp.]